MPSLTNHQGSGCSRLEGVTPFELAQRLQHLPGLVFFDTSGHVPAGSHNTVSIIAARPSQVHQGSIHCPEDLHVLGNRITGRSGAASADLGFPLGGLCGWIDYDGRFVFGEYPEMLVYHHGEQAWWEVGRLSSDMKDTGKQMPHIGPFQSHMNRQKFVDAVKRAKQWIASGDIYQVNLSQSFAADVGGGSLFPLYQTLRDHSPAPMAVWLSLAGREVLGSSPETFLRVSGRSIETRPIKGTRPRFADPDEDTRSAYELQTSSKEIAELVMITDLLRNDIGQVCEFGSVEVSDMLRLESLAQVHHLVSTIKGRLRDDVDHVQALAACFPGGSITGAPKKRAMEIIAALEPVPRGLYCGTVGYFGFNGESAFNIAIRTLVREGGRLSYHVGAGIVADSDPEKEYQETLHKAEGIRRALEAFFHRANDLRPSGG